MVAQFFADFASDAVVIAGTLDPVVENFGRDAWVCTLVRQASRTRATAPANRRQLAVSASSCFRPLRVNW